MRVPDDESDPEGYCARLDVDDDWKDPDVACTTDEIRDAAPECIMKGKEAFDDFCSVMRLVRLLFLHCHSSMKCTCDFSRVTRWTFAG